MQSARSRRKQPMIPRAESSSTTIPLCRREAYRSFDRAALVSGGRPAAYDAGDERRRGDGKSTTLVQYAIVFAQLGIRS